MKEQQATIEESRQRIEDLESRIAALEHLLTTQSDQK
jgi:hypothetical protein